MKLGEARRSRWGMSGLISTVSHLAIVVSCFIGVRLHHHPMAARGGAPELSEGVLEVEVVPAAVAAVAADPVGPPLVEPGPVPVTPRRGHRAPRQRPLVSVDPPLTREPGPVEPPPSDEDREALGLGDEPSEAPAPMSNDEDASDDAGAVVAALPAKGGGPTGAATGVGAAGGGVAGGSLGTPVESLFISPGEAGYLRTYETYPSLPRSLWVWGRVYSVLVRVCVSPEGRVSDVAIQRGAQPELDRLVAVTVRSWRYRPRLVAGTPRPFCHLIKLDFSVR
jgi:TonB family protein